MVHILLYDRAIVGLVNWVTDGERNYEKVSRMDNMLKTHMLRNSRIDPADRSLGTIHEQ